MKYVYICSPYRPVGEDPETELRKNIDQAKRGGSNKVSNLAGLCYDCHYGPMGVHNCQDTQDRLRQPTRSLNGRA